MPPDDQIPDFLWADLPRYFTEEPNGSVSVEAWARRHPRHRQLLEGARRVWDAAAGLESCADGPSAELAWTQFQARVDGRAARAGSEGMPAVDAGEGDVPPGC